MMKNHEHLHSQGSVYTAVPRHFVPPERNLNAEAPIPQAPLSPASIDLTSAAFFANPYSIYAQLCATERPVFDQLTGSWLVSRFPQVNALLRDSRVSKNFENPPPHPFYRSMLFQDPPQSTRIRGQLHQAFSAAMADNIEKRIEHTVDALIDPMPVDRPFDFIREFALPLPVKVITQLLGTPRKDEERLQQWATEAIGVEGVPIEEGLMRQNDAVLSLERYFGQLVDAPGSGLLPGFIATLLNPDQASDRLTRDELICNSILMILAGHETTVNLFGNGLHLLFSEPELFTRIKQDSSLLPAAIEEMLRLESPVQLGTFRITTEPIECGGVIIPAGDLVTLLLGAANRDPNVFNNPNSFDLTRAPGRHLAFGQGAHRCIGAWLGRTEARIGFARIFERYPNIRVAQSLPPSSWKTRAKQLFGIKHPVPSTAMPHWKQSTNVTRGLSELLIQL